MNPTYPFFGGKSAVRENTDYIRSGEGAQSPHCDGTDTRPCDINAFPLAAPMS